MKFIRLLLFAVLVTGLAACQADSPVTPDLGGSTPSAAVVPADHDAVNGGVDRGTVGDADGESRDAAAAGRSRPRKPRARLSASPSAIEIGQTSTLSWTTANATSVTLDGAPVAASGSQVVSPTTTKIYTLVAANAAGSKTATATVTVNAPPPPPEVKPTATLIANPGSIQTGESSTLSWTTLNATTVVLDGSAVAASGSLVVSPTATKTYTLTATNAAGSSTATATVTVTPPVMTLTYVRDIQPILSGSCVSCHSGSSPSAGLDLSTYAGVMTSVTPGSANSPLVAKTRSGGSMYKYFPSASAAQMSETIRSWVVDFNAVQQ